MRCDWRCGNPYPSNHTASCSLRRARAGAYWLGMLGFALAGPAAIESLRYYAQHSSHCSFEQWVRGETRGARRAMRPPCDCGLSDILAKAAG